MKIFFTKKEGILLLLHLHLLLHWLSARVWWVKFTWIDAHATDLFSVWIKLKNAIACELSFSMWIQTGWCISRQIKFFFPCWVIIGIRMWEPHSSSHYPLITPEMEVQTSTPTCIFPIQPPNKSGTPPWIPCLFTAHEDKTVGVLA